MIDRNTIARVMDAADIVDVVREFVTLRKAGVNLKGLCPFHNEKTPSFVVSPAKQICKCYGCGKGGNVVNFLMEIEQLSYPEAIKWLGRKYGIEVVDKELTAEDRQQQTLRESLFVVNEWAQEYFEKNLHESPDGIAIGLAYFRGRGLRDDIIRRFRLGYSPEQRDALAREALGKGYQKDYLVQTGLCFETEQGRLLDRYHGRVIYPVHSVSGKVVAFGGRILTNRKDVGKYVNSPESAIYSKSNELYGLWEAKKAIVKEGNCYMVEGYMDVISMHQSGVENVVASSGTSLTEGQIRLLHRFTNNITVLYDGDAAGIHASLRGIDMLLQEGMNIKVLLLPDGEDPDSFSQGRTPAEFKAYLEDHQVDFIRFKTELLLKGVGSDPIKRAELVTDIVRSISVIPSGIVRQTYAHECAQLMGMGDDVIIAEMNKMRRRARDAARQKEERQSEAAASDTPPAEQLPTVPMNLTGDGRIEQIERMLTQEVVRYGGTTLFDDDEGMLTVAAYIAADLQADQLELRNPLCRRVLDEAVAACADAGQGWDATHHFLNHPDAVLSALAAELATDDTELSQSHKLQYGNDADYLQERIPQLLNDYKMVLIEARLAALRQQLAEAVKAQDSPQVMSLLKAIKELSETHRLAGQVTDRTVTL